MSTLLGYLNKCDCALDAIADAQELRSQQKYAPDGGLKDARQIVCQMKHLAEMGQKLWGLVQEGETQ